ncbi:MAG: hypothetical protein ROO73_00165 [Roseivirga sp.]
MFGNFFTSQQKKGADNFAKDIKQINQVIEQLLSEGIHTDFYAFLSRTEIYDGVDAYDLGFELIPKQFVDKYIDAAAQAKSNVAKFRLQGTTLPIYFFALDNLKASSDINRILDSPNEALVQALKKEGIISDQAVDFFPWYQVRLKKATDQSKLIGDFYLEDYEADDDAQSCPLEVEIWKTLDNPATFVSLMNLFDSPVEVLPTTPSKEVLTAGKPLGGLGVMDVGAGGCNMLFGTDGEPVCYFDVGKGNGAPPYLKSNAGSSKRNPILQNSTSDLKVILSHWDNDHWGLAKRKAYKSSFQSLTWIVPDPGIHSSSPTCQRFLKNVGISRKIMAPFTKKSKILNFACDVYLSRYPGKGSTPVINNNRNTIGMLVTVAGGKVFMPGDASFKNFIALSSSAKFRVLLATHHGSSKHGATAGIPAAQTGSGINSYLCYSYGMSSRTARKHYYGHPTQAAIKDYTAKNWKIQFSTAEGKDINQRNFPDARGNIWVGSQKALDKFKDLQKSDPILFSKTAFSDYEYELKIS